MTWFAVETVYIADTARRDEIRPLHREYLQALVDQGKVLAGGPWADDSAGFAVYQVDDPAEMDVLLAEDPYTVHEIAQRRVVHEWRITMGSWAGKAQ